jgi:hypothetical protein
MTEPVDPHSQERLEMVRWAAVIGAVTASALARREDASLASARARLAAARGRGLLRANGSTGPGDPLFTATRQGLRACGRRSLRPPRVTAANTSHWRACAIVAAAFARAYPDGEILGEPALREAEREGPPVAAATSRSRSGAVLHRPDLALLGRAGAAHRTLAVEVELSVKAPARLAEICRAWARCRAVSGIVYVAARDVLTPLERAVTAAHAADRIIVLPLDAFLDGLPAAPIAGAVPGGS